ncbi:MAG: PBP1A family penicillin-binding protein [Deltaproteobacteria bacterium]|nr:PBP1A family penicillin-binding protein [Deltaproteobacteria bacterium]
MPPRKRTSRRSKGRPWRWSHIHLSICLLAVCLLLSGLITASLYSLVALHIPAIDSLASYHPSATTIILDKNNHEIGHAYTENRRLKNFAQLPPLLPRAFVAAEDARFYQHPGVDIWSILRAMVHNMESGRRGQGGSTITQQVARALLLSPEKTYTRKIKEAILAYRIDHALSKDEILHIYLNQIYLGAQAYGVGAAAMTYFGKPVGSLNLAEIAILAGLPQAPSSYSPLRHLQRAKRRQAYVLNRMVEDHYISAPAARAAFKMPLKIQAPPEMPPAAGYFVQYIKKYIRRKYGAKLLMDGGLTVYTTLDLRLQQTALQALRRGLAQLAVRQSSAKTPPQAALISIEVKTGKVRAVVGGDNFQTSQFDRAIQAKRQPGSAFKPIIYAAALESSFTPNTIIDDAPIAYKNANGIWRPQNFSGNFFGPTTVRNGLVYSRNIVAIKILQAVGINRVIRLAGKMGITSPLTPNLALALGASEVSLLELTNSYTVFANGGYYRAPVFINKIVDRNGKILERNRPDSRRVISAGTAYQLTNIMQGVIQTGTGRAARGIKYAAGKTGTTDKNMDAWFVGYTPILATGVWVGYDRHKSLGRRETGGHAAAPIWHNFMAKAAAYRSGHDFPVPPGITFVPIDRDSGNFEYENPDNALWEAFKKKRLPDWEKRRQQN